MVNASSINKIENRLTRKEILRIALPVVLEQMAVMLLGIINTIMVGNISKQAMSAVGIVDTFSRCVFPLFSGIGTGCTIIISNRIGMKDDEGACKVVKQGVYFGAIISVVFTLVMYFFQTPILSLLYGNAEQQVMDYILTYFRISLFSYPFMFLIYIINGALRGSGNTKTPFWITFAMNLVGSAVGYVLIYGVDLTVFGERLYLEAMGVEGAALSISIARVFGAILGVLVIIFGKNQIKLKSIFKFKFDFPVIKQILGLGIPYGLEQFFIQTGKLLLQLVIINMGTTAIAVHTIGLSVSTFCTTGGYGFNLAAVALIGQCKGAGDREKAKKYSKTIMNMDLLLLGALSVIILIFAQNIVALYNGDPEVIKIGANILRMYSIFLPLYSFAHVISGSLRGSGDTKYPMIATFAGVWVFRLGLAYLFGIIFNLGIYGVWIAMSLDVVIRAVLLQVRYRSQNWLKSFGELPKIAEEENKL